MNIRELTIQRRKSILRNQNFGLLLSIIVIILLVAIAAPKFISTSNIINLLQTVSITGIMALGMAMVVITGNIDLSVASMISFIACLTALLVHDGFLNDVTALPFGLLLGVGCGALNGILISRFKAESFIITLGTQIVFQGLAMLSASGTVVSIVGKFEWFGKLKFGSVPLQTVLFIVLVVVVYLIMKYSKYGRRIYALGGNPEASFLAGINNRRHKFLVFTVNGLICSISAMIILSKLSAANPQMASGYEMDAITSCVVGGITLSGGKGDIPGCFMGIMLMGVIQNALNILNVSIFYQDIIMGIVLLGAVLIRATERTRKRKESKLTTTN